MRIRLSLASVFVDLDIAKRQTMRLHSKLKAIVAHEVRQRTAYAIL